MGEATGQTTARAVRTCPFCGATGVKFSKEHWLPADWGQYFPKLPNLISARHDYDGGSTSRTENLSHFDKQFDGICRTCNSGWLREIDVAAKHVALDLAYRRRIHVAAPEVLPLSASLYRAALIGMWGQRDAYGLPARRFPELYQLRRPPGDVHILLGHNDEGFLYAGGNYSALTVDGANETAVRSFAFGGLGHLFVVVLVSEPELAAVVNGAARAVKRAAGGSLVTLWPNRRRRVDLPSRSISRDTAARVTELGVALGLRDQPVERTPIPERVRAKYPTREAINSSVRMPSKQIDW
ncbi:hypothetical protein [Microbacterium xanthum]|uniref:hypothetical protein n=1 Tax=Microbacterium xanthum TaxID=3079794 RepID=UPI002AD55EA5|nr:hypothetical protein [Microbacterium sp. KSW-48]MDZ8172430.1 hypothetical protein [Microbacterium sp. KSW-48]